MANEIQKQEEGVLKQYFDSPGIKSKFQELLGQRAPAFLTSLLQVANGNETLRACSPVSIFNSAATAATLDLPINQNLGFAWIVPFKGQAQFQMGYKGYIQLAQRSGQYSRINAIAVYSNQFKSWDELTETLVADFSVEGSGDVAGFVAYFRLLNGYQKTVFWSKEKVWNHARKFSKSLGDKSIWNTDFDSMALKTVIKNMLSKWGILSVEMQKAIQVDQAVINDPEGNDFHYPDNETTNQDRAEGSTGKALEGMTIIKPRTANPNK